MNDAQTAKTVQNKHVLIVRPLKTKGNGRLTNGCKPGPDAQLD